MYKYEKIKVIGKGAFGEAVLVRVKSTDEFLVAKQIDLGRISAKESAAIDTEVKVLAQLDHPNITQYIESFSENDLFFIMLEYADGGDLHEKIRAQLKLGVKPGSVLFTEEQVRIMFAQLCLALQHLHARKILHRDLKTRNIFLTKSGQVKLGDFGLSTVLKNTLAQANTMCGTPYYFSPELCRNKPYNSKSDVWALGCILYEMCTLKHAFDAGNMKLLLQKIVKGEYPPISTMYSQELSSIIKLMLNQDETQRPSVVEILEMPYMQETLKNLAKNLERLSDEEEEAWENQKEVVTKFLRNSSSSSATSAAAKLRQESETAQLQELKVIRTSDRSALKDFLRGPPPSEQQQQQQPTTTTATASHVSSVADILAMKPQDSADLPPIDPTSRVRLCGAQYRTLTGQIDRLMCKDGKRSKAAEDDLAVVEEKEDDNPMKQQDKPNVDTIRKFLISELGEAKFNIAHSIISAITVDADEDETAVKIKAILGAKNYLMGAFSQLVRCEELLQKNKK